MKLTFPHMGNTYIVVKAMLDELGVDYIIPPFNSKKSLEIGTKLAPEMACLPLKINLGNYVEAYNRGADTILITGGRGPCRFGYYCEMSREILQDNGYKMDVITLEIPKNDPMEFIRRIKGLTGHLNPFKIVPVVKETAILSKKVDELERLVFKLRPRELERGSVDRIYKLFFQKVKLVKGIKSTVKLIEDTRNSLYRIKIKSGFEPLKVGIIGEIYTTIDSSTNFNIEAVLGNMGIEVDRSVTLSGWIFDHMLKSLFPFNKDISYQKEAKPYLGAMIGGHAQETIGNAVKYAKSGYHGIIQIYPLTCMPEIVAQSILPAIERDYDIPILTLVIDELTGEAGYMTRIEAFTDLLIRRREILSDGEDYALSGN